MVCILAKTTLVGKWVKQELAHQFELKQQTDLVLDKIFWST
jgi:hypothetical protein